MGCREEEKRIKDLGILEYIPRIIHCDSGLVPAPYVFSLVL